MCEELGIPFWVSERDADAAEDPELIRQRQPNNPMARFYIRIFMGPGHPVDRQLHDGDEVAGFKVLDVPGHSAGHVAFWRESDGVLVLGDVLANMDQLTLIPGLHEPKPYLTPDPDREPPFGEEARTPGAEARPLRSRRPASRHEEVRRLRRGSAGLATWPVAQNAGLRQVRSCSRSRTAWTYCFAGSVHHRPANQAPTLPQRSPGRYSRPRSTVFSHSILPSK